jgi:8-oxo-dGTP pyrophosphatase MutT (NUDIX family)
VTSSSAEYPGWFAPLLEVVAHAEARQLGVFAPPVGRAPRRSAVLILFGHADAGPEVLLTERAADLRSHAGQVAFPGGALDPTDGGPVAAALREAREETGLDPAGVQVAGPLPDLYLMVSDFVVTPVVAWWREPAPVGAINPAEVARVVRVPVAELTDPANRFRVTHPSGYVGPGFSASGLFVWGFTAGILDRLLHLTGWERPWDLTRSEPLPATLTSTELTPAELTPTELTPTSLTTAVRSTSPLSPHQSPELPR